LSGFSGNAVGLRGCWGRWRYRSAISDGDGRPAGSACCWPGAWRVGRRPSGSPWRTLIDRVWDEAPRDGARRTLHVLGDPGTASLEQTGRDGRARPVLVVRPRMAAMPLQIDCRSAFRSAAY